MITLGANAVIDVIGGTTDALLGGTVSFRAPLLNTGDVNLTIARGAQIKGSRATTLEAFAVWSTDDPLAATNGAAKHFDGIIDPAVGTTPTATWCPAHSPRRPAPPSPRWA